MTETDTDALVIDLDRERKQRAAEREGKRQEMPIRLGGETIAVLPVELPIDVLAPLRNLDDSITLLLRSAMQATRTQDAKQRWDATELIVDLLAATPTLPLDVIAVLRQVAENLLGVEGLDKLLGQRPSAEDYGALAKGVFRFYGLTLGEVSPSSDSSTDSGRTSNTTSSTNSESTPEVSGTDPENPDSSESVAS
jgi:hypothetical protein